MNKAPLSYSTADPLANGQQPQDMPRNNLMTSDQRPHGTRAEPGALKVTI